MGRATASQRPATSRSVKIEDREDQDASAGNGKLPIAPLDGQEQTDNSSCDQNQGDRPENCLFNAPEFLRT